MDDTVVSLEKVLKELEAKAGGGTLKDRFAHLLDEMGVKHGSYYDGTDVLFIPHNFNGDTGENLLAISFQFTDDGDKLVRIIALVGEKSNRERLKAKLEKGEHNVRN